MHLQRSTKNKVTNFKLQIMEREFKNYDWIGLTLICLFGIIGIGLVVMDIINKL